MHRGFQLAGLLAIVAIANPAAAAPGVLVQPVQLDRETIRYDQGVPTVDLELRDGVVQITPLALDHGSLSFGIAVYNDTRVPADFALENITAVHNGTPVQLLTHDDLSRKAKNRALWASLAIAAVGGLAAGVAANQRYQRRAKMVTPRGTYRYSDSAPSTAGQIQAAAISAGAGVSIARVRGQLDRTLADLRDEIVQRSTVDPGESYAGRVVLAKIKPRSLPARVEIALRWNGETYPFAFQIASLGTPAPSFAAVARQSDLTDFRPRPAIVPAVFVPPAEPRNAPAARPILASVPVTRSAPAALPSGGGLVSVPSASTSWGLVSVTPANARP